MVPWLVGELEGRFQIVSYDGIAESSPSGALAKLSKYVCLPMLLFSLQNHTATTEIRTVR